MDLATLILFAGALALAAGSPGPSVAALVARVLARGPGDVWPFLAAMWLGETLWMSFAVWGLAALAQSFGTVFTVIRWAGVAYLLWLAWRMWTADPTAKSELPDRRSGLRMFAAGTAITFGNPKIMAFYVALLPSLVDLARISVTGWMELVAVTLAVLAAVDLAWVVAASRARRLFRSERGMRLANRASAGMMAGAAAAIAARG